MCTVNGTVCHNIFDVNYGERAQTLFKTLFPCQSFICKY
jgi:hypothetical protein